MYEVGPDNELVFAGIQYLTEEAFVASRRQDDPSPAEIAERAAQVRARWTPEDFELRGRRFDIDEGPQSRRHATQRDLDEDRAVFLPEGVTFGS